MKEGDEFYDWTCQNEPGIWLQREVVLFYVVDLRIFARRFVRAISLLF